MIIIKKFQLARTKRGNTCVFYNLKHYQFHWWASFAFDWSLEVQQAKASQIVILWTLTDMPKSRYLVDQKAVQWLENTMIEKANALDVQTICLIDSGLRYYYYYYYWIVTLIHKSEQYKSWVLTRINKDIIIIIIWMVAPRLKIKDSEKGTRCQSCCFSEGQSIVCRINPILFRFCEMSDISRIHPS